MNSDSFFITTASWEPRFILGFDKIVQEHDIKSVIMYYFSEYSEVTLTNREEATKICHSKDIEITEVELNQQVESWKTIFRSIEGFGLSRKNVIIDISTMPRETIWTIFHLLKSVASEIQYVYYKPEGYSEEWLSRDPGKPRLVYKLSGIAQLGKPTVLMIVTGFDIDRVNQLIHFFEPEVALLGVQTGSQYSNLTLNMQKHIAEFTNNPGIKIFKIDAYSDDRGLQTIKDNISPYVNSSNIIMSSLGPKLSAVSLFNIKQVIENIGLAYAPSREFNPEYSYGIGDLLSGYI